MNIVKIDLRTDPFNVVLLHTVDDICNRKTFFERLPDPVDRILDVCGKEGLYKVDYLLLPNAANVLYYINLDWINFHNLSYHFSSSVSEGIMESVEPIIVKVKLGEFINKLD